MEFTALSISMLKLYCDVVSIAGRFSPTKWKLVIADYLEEKMLSLFFN